jgi:hypothetical protein
MKKKIIGIFAAALLFGSSIGYAASSSLIGAKVTGLFTLQYSNKSKIADAVIINGSAYVPVRKMAEATGTELTVEGKTITIETTAEETPDVSEETAEAPTVPATVPVINLTKEERDILTLRITKLENGLAAAQEELVRTQERLAVSTDVAEVQRLSKRITEIETSIKGAQKALDADKARLAADGQ